MAPIMFVKPSIKVLLTAELFLFKIHDLQNTKAPIKQPSLFVTIHFFSSKTVNLFVNIKLHSFAKQQLRLKVSFDIAKEINIICMYTFFKFVRVGLNEKTVG